LREVVYKLGDCLNTSFQILDFFVILSLTLLNGCKADSHLLQRWLYSKIWKGTRILAIAEAMS
jgi:hypothetical protein